MLTKGQAIQKEKTFANFFFLEGDNWSSVSPIVRKCHRNTKTPEETKGGKPTSVLVDRVRRQTQYSPSTRPESYSWTHILYSHHKPRLYILWRKKFLHLTFWLKGNSQISRQPVVPSCRTKQFSWGGNTLTNESKNKNPQSKISCTFTGLTTSRGLTSSHSSVKNL